MIGIKTLQNARQVFKLYLLVTLCLLSLCKIAAAQTSGRPPQPIDLKVNDGSVKQPPDPRCKAIKFDGSFTGHINLVFVPSGFNNDMVFFADRVAWIAGIFNNYEPFQESIKQLNILYVPVESGSYCSQPCSGIDRLLCCTVTTARDLSGYCTTGNRQTIVVHNSTTYGGAGNSGADMATTTINDFAPRVAIHELGHSLFNLGDEYSYGGSTPAAYPNCEVAGCPRWTDMIGYNGVGCLTGYCAQGQYFASENTLMSALDYPFEEVNLRLSCCIYYQETGNWPDYCSQFNRFSGGNLNNFCKVTPSSGASAPPEYLETPEQLTFVLSKDSNEWMLLSTVKLPSGYYKSERIHGQSHGKIKVELTHTSGKKKELQFEEDELLEYPGPEKKMGGYIHRRREILWVILDTKLDGALAVSKASK